MQSVRTPLGFCALALLIVEAFILGAGTLFGLPIEWKLIAIGVGVLLFVMVFWTVVWLVVKHPRKLVFSASSYVEIAALVFGEKGHPVTGAQLENMPQQETPTPPVGQLPDSNQAK
jgi:hypothetical protein